jgi:hypothetical protein
MPFSTGYYIGANLIEGVGSIIFNVYTFFVREQHDYLPLVFKYSSILFPFIIYKMTFQTAIQNFAKLYYFSAIPYLLVYPNKLNILKNNPTNFFKLQGWFCLTNV